MAESALVIFTPEAEALVGNFREKYDPSASRGMPAHVTLLYPFKSPDQLTSAVIGKLQSCFEAFAPFNYSFSEIRRFPGVLYLAPKIAEAFQDLTQAIWKIFPEYPPYEGRYDDIVPHLSVAAIDDEAQLDHVDAQFQKAAAGGLPFQARATDITLMENSSGRWRVVNTLRLGKN